jgi:trehalose/maltose transport system permease protein
VLFLLPALLTLVVVAAWPLGRTFYLSLTDASASASASGATKFVGLDNFFFLLTDPAWWSAVENTLLFSIVSVAAETVLGIGIALVLNEIFPGRGLVRAAVLIPWAIPPVVSAQLWMWMYHDVYGVINYVLLRLDVISGPIAWTANQNIAMISLIIADVWKTAPFMALLVLAGLQTLPQECYDAAKVDGISPIKVFFGVTLPLLVPTLQVAVLFRLLDALRVFDLMYVIMGNNTTTATMSIYVRQNLVDFQEFGYGSAASTCMFLLIGLITVLYIGGFKVRLVQDAQ